MASKKKKRPKVRTPRPIARAAWERNGAGAHTDKKHKSKSDACRDWDLEEELDN